MLFRIDTDGRAAEAVPADSFSDLEYHERYDIQEWVLDNPGLLGEPLLVISSEFSGFDRTSERLDVLAMDQSGRLVVIELKRTAAGTQADLQALRYAAYCSTLQLQDAAELRARFRSDRGKQLSVEDARDEIERFVEEPDFEDLDDKPRIILAADDFGPEITATVLWLRSFGVDVRCVRMTPYSVGDDLVVDSTVLIPLPEAEDFVIRREKKEASRASKSRTGRPTLEEYLDTLPEDVRPYLEALREHIMEYPNVKETVFNTLISYRRASDNAWMTWLTSTKTQARFGVPQTQEFPEEMGARATNDWMNLKVTNKQELQVAREVLDEWFANLPEEQDG